MWKYMWRKNNNKCVREWGRENAKLVRHIFSTYHNELYIRIERVQGKLQTRPKGYKNYT